MSDCRTNGPSGYRTVGLSDCRNIGLSDYSYGPKVNKANSIFAVLRTFRSLNADIFLPLYKTLVRTHLDYASSVCAPYKKKYIDKIESVQKRATKQIPGLTIYAILRD